MKNQEKQYYLQSVGINKAQEDALRKLCDDLWNYQMNNPIIYFDSNSEMCITHPFYEESGRFLSNPIEEYGDSFTNSEFVEIAKNFKLEPNDNEYEIKVAVNEKLAELIKPIILKNIKDDDSLTEVLVELLNSITL